MSVVKVAGVTALKISFSILLALASWLPVAAFLITAYGCAPKGSGPSASLPSSVRSALQGSNSPTTGGQTGSGTATFSAIVVDPSTWQGSPVGTGQFSIQFQPAVSGGPSSVAATDPTSSAEYVFIGNFDSGTGTGLAIASATPFAVGTAQVSATQLVVATVDVSTGQEIAQASSGTLTITAAGTGVNAYVTGSFSGTFQPVTQSACATNADCPSGEICVSGTCVPNTPPACRTNADCPAGEVCVNGSCVASTPQCQTNADCPSGQTCVSGTCVPNTPPACRTNADCPAGETCVNGTCVGGPPPCQTNADCPPGQTCQSGVCVGSTGGSCMGLSGAASFSITEPAVAACSILTSVSVNVSQAVASTGPSLTGAPGPAIVLFDPSTPNPSQVLAIQLASCPSAAGTINVGSGVDGYFLSSGAASGHVQVYAQYQAISGSVNFTQVGTTLAGTATFTFDNGGTATATFSVQ
jgi:Cys-rich repeat protein